MRSCVNRHGPMGRPCLPWGLLVCSVFVSPGDADGVMECVGDRADMWFARANDFPLAGAYNGFMAMTLHRQLWFVHPDVAFSPDVFAGEAFLEENRQVAAFGLAGVSAKGDYVFADKIVEPTEVETLDGCFLAVRKDVGLSFDDATFDGLHLYAEDYCCQARDRGLCSVVFPARSFLHKSLTMSQRGAMWGDYGTYYARLQRKWEGKFGRVKTT